MNSANPNLRDSIVQEIAIAAPALRIFDALTDPVQLVKWWGIEGRFQVTHAESDLRPAGRLLMTGIGMQGRPFIIRGEYREIDRPRLLVFTWLPDWQEEKFETLVRIDLEEASGTTVVRLTHSGLSTDSSRASHQGWPQLLDRLRIYAEPREQA